MGTFVFTTAKPPTVGTARALATSAAALKRLWSWMVRAHQQRRAEAEFKHLNDAALKDIGMHRSEISSVVYLGRKDITRRAR